MTCLGQDRVSVFHLRRRERARSRRLAHIDVTIEPEWEQTEALVGFIVFGSIDILPQHFTLPYSDDTPVGVG